MIETDQVADFVERDGAHGGAVERLAAAVVNREDDVRLDDPPVIVVRPQRLAADLLVEAIDPRDVDVGLRRVDERT